jgi:hypothetical protein
MRKHRTIYDVTDGEDIWDICHKLIIDRDLSFGICGDAYFIKA